jgi:(p)ppGpp synthase/HD superfamily hydrolase
MKNDAKPVYLKLRDVIAAAILHDTVEDAGVALTELTEKFGADVAGVG